MSDKTEDFEIVERQGISFLELLHVLAKRKLTIVKICLGAAVVAAAYAMTLPNIYSATAKVLPPQKDSSAGLSALLGQGGMAAAAAAGLGSGSDIYLGILKSRSVEDAVAQRFNLVKAYDVKTPEAARQKLDGALNVRSGKDGIINITVEDEDPKRSAQMANAFVDELMKTTVRLNLTKAGSERLFLEKRLDMVRKDLKGAEDDLKAFSQRNKIVQMESQAKASIEGITRMKSDLSRKEVQLAVLLKQQTEQSPEVQAVRAAINSLRSELAALTGSNSADGIPAVSNVPGVGLEYSRKMRELKTQELLYEQLTKQYEMAKLNEAKDSSSLQILDEAVPPVRKIRPLRSSIVFLTTVTAFFFSVFLAFIMEYFEQLPEERKLVFQNLKKQAFSFR
ncbi:lipopolysaccharide biosynthesis protein [Geomonas nitrogeniifigens]|uniref:Lipopolysaccharide biosynthesis protein n=1 Tax=Geomonas diazotrophica TaxID=2843197 RepID=A0ABX8JC29_9BACT|nr:Wzz/FepE/Etk N-terminal domain-containing protein [Geomonas nitrogeniifigens]QWV95978.1 lipopolysaccharide biosynthesis protein [Geomonas nitrogeniifigens]